MKKFLYSLRTDLQFSTAIRQHTFLLRATPRVYPFQEPLNTALVCQPSSRLSSVVDGLGNLVHQGYIDEPHDRFVFCSTGEVIIDSNKKDLEKPHPYYRLETSLTKLEGDLKNFYDDNYIQGSIDEKVMHWMTQLSRNFCYRTGITGTQTTSAEAFAMGGGVCQDYAQILLTLLRSDNIPCRYVVGLLAGEGASHAWVEVFNDHFWLAVDPTHTRICNDEYLKISHGLDFSTCSVERGMFIGEASQVMSTKALMKEV
ncbi:MAG: transglutaminase [Burkholderiaceae bacterium]|nr:transglutaminase [Burkholderiaceae bacterium]